MLEQRIVVIMNY